MNKRQKLTNLLTKLQRQRKKNREVESDIKRILSSKSEKDHKEDEIRADAFLDEIVNTK